MVSIREEEVMWKMKQYVLREEQENKDDMQFKRSEKEREDKLMKKCVSIQNS